MDLIQKFMNILLPPIALITLLFFLPPFLVFKFIYYIIRSTNSENVGGKVVLITGASSGIGEYLAYEYARRGAYLVLAARRVDRLREVADKARCLGSPDVMVIRADVSNVEDSKRLVHEAVNHFGRLDHLVNNAGIIHSSMFEDPRTISDFTPVMVTAFCVKGKMIRNSLRVIRLAWNRPNTDGWIRNELLSDVNFWGSVYSAHFAVPHLRKSKGKLVVIASCGGWLPAPRMSIYNASKAAIIALYDTLRIEFGSDIGITIVTPGVIESEMTHEYQSKLHLDFVPPASTEGCAKAIVNSTCCGERYLVEPSWYNVWFLWKLLCPEVVDWCSRWLYITRPMTSERDATINKTETQKFLSPASIQSPELKTD